MLGRWGTLFAFVLVAVGVIVLRFRDPDRHRPFRVPGSPVTPLIAIASCVFLMMQLPLVTWVRFLVWLAIGLGIYLVYGMRRRTVAHQEAPDYQD